MTQTEKNEVLLRKESVNQRIHRASLHEEIVSRLRILIQDGTLPPGTRVPEMKLCEQFEISRTPLREALKVLASEGLVVLLPNRGSMVSRVEVEELTAVFEVMESLEALTGHLVCERISEEGKARLRRLHAAMVDCYQAGDRPGYFRLNQKIHLALVGYAANPVLASTYEQLSTKVNRARAMANSDERRWGESLAEHEEIMAALDTMRPELLASTLKDHLHNTAQAVIKGLQAAD